jgi:hypothetical protein
MIFWHMQNGDLVFLKVLKNKNDEQVLKWKLGTK